jgi:hypothetical protein
VIEQIWNGILTWGSQFIIPDWGGLISLLPVFMLVIVILILARMVWMYATIGPRRVRRPRRPPVPPPGLHMPGPTYAPIFGAIGAFFLFLGLVFGGLWILVGLIALVLGLLYWGREALRDYDHVAETYPALVAPPPTTPPPGVHMPGPTFRPFVLALGLGFLFLGLVFPGWILLFGVVFTIVPLLGWLRDAGKEYGHTVEADRIGHVTNEPAPSWPRRLFWIMGILLAGRIRRTGGGRDHGRRQGREVQHREDRRARRQGLHDHVRQPGRRHAARHRHPRLDRQEGRRQQGLPWGRDEDLRHPGDPGRNLQIRVLHSSGPDERRARRGTLTWRRHPPPRPDPGPAGPSSSRC